MLEGESPRCSASSRRYQDFSGLRTVAANIRWRTRGIRALSGWVVRIMRTIARDLRTSGNTLQVRQYEVQLVDVDQQGQQKQRFEFGNFDHGSVGVAGVSL